MDRTAGTQDSERRQATVLFADISGFTQMSERMDPEDVTTFINACFAALETVVVIHGGVVDKYIGDCVMAVFGLTPADGTPSQQAVKAAVEMREAIYQLNRQAQLPAPLDVHIGIGAGAVIAGVMGGDTSRAFTVIGDAVDLATALEHESVTGQILVGPHTYEETRHDFDYRPVPPIRLRATQEPIAIYELAGAKPARLVKRDSERRQATVVFADVTGFKALAEHRSPEELTQVLNHCFTTLESAVRNHGGVIDKFIGECAMALFGLPNAIENAPKQAINAAIEMRNDFAALNRDLGLPVPLGLHIGINTGLVIAGEIGGRVKRSFTAMGDTVNLAARLKEAAGDGAIYAGAETYRYTRDDFEWRGLDPLTLKGKERAVPAYELVSSKEHVHRQKAPATGAGRMIFSAMVGRDKELGLVEQQLRRLTEGVGSIVAIIGEAGMGKSRLVSEVLALDGVRRARVLEGRCLAMGQNLSFHPFVDLLRQWAGIREDDTEARALNRLEHAISTAAGEETGEILPFIATMMGMHVTGVHAQRIQGIEGEALERLMIRSTRTLFDHLAQEKPLVLIFEDLHWADLSSVRLLETLLRLVVRHRVLFIGVGRPDSPETMDRILQCARESHALQYVEIGLGRLTDQQCDALIQNLMQTDDLPFSVRALIIRKAEGNPFYIEEVIRSLIDAGAVEHHGGRFRVTERIDTVEIPGTIQGVIMTRVDRLDEPTRHVLQVASVIGRSVHHQILADVMTGERDLDARLAYLEERQLLMHRRTRETAIVRRRTFVAEIEYVFTHALLQETIYESILQKTRRELHCQVAESIESTFADRLADFYGMLAYHYSRAENPEKAEEYLFKAGEEAARSAASSEALTFFREASRLYLQIHGGGGDPDKKAILEKHIGLALMNTGNLTESMEHFDQALMFLGDPIPTGIVAAAAQFLGDFAAVFLRLFLPAFIYRSVEGRARFRDNLQVRYPRIKAQSTSNPTRLVFDYFRAIRWLNRTDPTTVPDQVIGLYSGFAAMFAYSGVSFRIGRRYLAISERLLRPGDVKDRFDHQCLVCICNYLEGKWNDEDGVVDDEVIEGALRYGGLWEVNTYLGLDCDRRLRRGDFKAARERLAKLAEIGDVYGFEFAQTNHDAQTTLLLLEERHLPAALQAADRYFARVYDDTLRVLALGSKSEAQVLLGDREGAAATLNQVEQIVKRSPMIPPWHLSAYAVGRFWFDVDALEAGARTGGVSRRELARQARRSAAAAHRVARRVAVQRPEVYRLTARMHWLLGSQRRARHWWQKTIVECERMGARPELARTYAEVGLRLTAAGPAEFNGIAVTEYVERARRLFAELGLAWETAQAEARLRRAA